MTRWTLPRLGAALVCAALGAFAPSALAQAPANDPCATPTPIAGTGLFNFDNTFATDSPEGQDAPNCNTTGQPTIFTKDIWFCWTPSCNGVATITTCGLTQVDTAIAIYEGCVCPGPAPNAPRCCNDDTNNPVCGEQSTVVCDVECGHTYMIRIASKPGTAPGAGRFSIACNGTPCDVGGGTCPPNDVCCGTKPKFTDPAYATFTGSVALSTYRPQAPGAPFVLSVFNLGNYQTNLPYTAPINGAGAPATGGPDWPGYSPTYHPADATPAKMGNVFGLTLDGAGNVYLAQTSSYSGDGIGSLAAGAHGTIYQIDGVTSVGYKLISLPNTNATGSNEDWPELGNIHWDCAHNQMFASNLDDGRIYRITLSSAHAGAIQSCFDHATGTILTGAPASLPEAGDAAGFAPLGERVWAVQAHGGRLYYSVWSQDLSGANVGPNTIHSIALTGAGEFTGVSQLEVTVPSPAGGVVAPVADISFSPTGLMLLGERCMSGDTSMGAHSGRVLEYQCNGGTWAPSANLFTPGLPNSSTGGVDYDNAPGGRVWMSADAIHLAGGCDNIYGLQGSPATGGTAANSVLLDNDGDTCSQDKTQLGDVEISCYVPACMQVVDGRIICDTDPASNCFTWNFTVTNNSAVTAYYVLLAPQPGSTVTFTPNILPLTPPLAPGQSRNLSTTICGAPCAGGPGCQICFTVFLVDQHIDACCSIDHCIEVPDCSCAQIPDDTLVCVGSNTYTYTFTIQNLSAGPVEHLFLFAPTGTTVSPTYIALSPSLAPGATAGPFVVSITGPAGSVVCLTMSIHNHQLQECCSFIRCLTLPTPCSGPINVPPAIIAHPVPVDVNAGQPAVFTVGVIGSQPLDYQWRRNGVDLVDNARFQGVTTGTVTVYPTQTPDTGLISVAISNPYGSLVSLDAALTVYCAVDLNHNHSIEPSDIALFITTWSTSLTLGNLDGDFDGNGRVEPSDVGAFVNAWFAAINGC